MADAVLRVLLKPGAAMPSYATQGAAGADLRALLETPLLLGPGERAAVPTGLSIELPQGYEAQLRPRSGLALNSGVTCLNSPGTIDSDYRGEIRVILVNHGKLPVTIMPGERIAQLVVAPVARADFVAVQSLDATPRGAGGFGSTGSR